MTQGKQFPIVLAKCMRKCARLLILIAGILPSERMKQRQFVFMYMRWVVMRCRLLPCYRSFCIMEIQTFCCQRSMSFCIVCSLSRISSRCSESIVPILAPRSLSPLCVERSTSLIAFQPTSIWWPKRSFTCSRRF